MKGFFAALLAIAGMIIGFLFYLNNSYYNKPLGNGKNIQTFEVNTGESFQSIVVRLEERKLIDQGWILNLLARFYGLRGKMRAGEYSLNDRQSPHEILKILSGGKSITYPFTITEGMNFYEVASLYESKGFGIKENFINVCQDVELLERILGVRLNHCEGYLYPETYNFERKTTAKQMIEVMLKTFVKKYDSVAKGRNLGGWSRHQITTFASLIEKETGADFERPIIASVFYNRLSKKMRLQTDPTVLYGILMETGIAPINITKKDLTTPTPYNTYTIYGLPPGPIANPGEEALKAVFEPQQTEFLFFVSKNDGTHEFTVDYQNHSEAVKKYQLDIKAREGKSWRDLKNRK